MHTCHPGCTHARAGASSYYYCCSHRTSRLHGLYGVHRVGFSQCCQGCTAWPWQIWHFKPTVEKALAKEKDLLANAEGPTIAVHLRGGDKRQENADLVRGPRTLVLPAGVSKMFMPHPCGTPAWGG